MASVDTDPALGASLRAAMAGLQAGLDWAQAQHRSLGIVIVDSAGVVASARMDEAYPSVFEVARAKALAAHNFRAETEALWERMAEPVRIALGQNQPQLLLLPGGAYAPDARLAVGISGASGAEDAACARHVAEAMSRAAG